MRGGVFWEGNIGDWLPLLDTKKTCMYIYGRIDLIHRCVNFVDSLLRDLDRDTLVLSKLRSMN